MDPRRHPADERVWIIRTFNRADLPMTYLARNRMRRAEMLALGHAQRLLRGDCARRRWIRVADRLVYIVKRQVAPRVPIGYSIPAQQNLESVVWHAVTAGGRRAMPHNCQPCLRRAMQKLLSFA